MYRVGKSARLMPGTSDLEYRTVSALYPLVDGCHQHAFAPDNSLSRVHLSFFRAS